MRKIALLAFAFCAFRLFAQPANQAFIIVSSAPSGPCSSYSAARMVGTTGVIYTCQSGTWAVAGGGGGGGPYLPLAGGMMTGATGGSPISGGINATQLEINGTPLSTVVSETHTAAGVAELDFTTCLAGNPHAAQVTISNVQNATSGTIGIQVSTNGGSTYDTTSGHYVEGQITQQIGAGTTPGNTGNVSSTEFDLIGAVTANVYLINSTIFMQAPSAATVKTWTALQQENTTGVISYLNAQGFFYTQTAAINAFRVISSTTFNGTVTCTVTAP